MPPSGFDFQPIDFANELNPEQLAAVTAPDGPALVLAGAGSGKTRTLTYRVAYLLNERGVHRNDILLLTFTNKAAKEMLERVVDLTGLAYPPKWGGTFHSVGGRLLREFGGAIGLEANYNVLDEDDANSLFNTAVKDLDPAYSRDKENPKPKVLRELYSYARNTQTDLEELLQARFPWRPSLVKQASAFCAEYQSRKKAQQVCDYDDLLVYWLELVRDHPQVQAELERRFRYVLVDEYQDTNGLQSAIIDGIAGHHNVMAVGDDAQCIYTWRGADFENIRSFPERHPGAEIFPIVRNYRSTPEILSLANAVLAAQPSGSGFSKDLVAVNEPGLLPLVVRTLDARQQAQFLTQKIEQLYDEGVALRDIAILYRAHYQALDVQLEFSRRGLPFVITSGVRFFEQAHIRDFVAQIRVLSNPRDYSAWQRLLGLLPKVGPATVRKVLVAAQAAAEKARKELEKQRQGGLFDPTAPRNPHADSVITALGSESVVKKIPAPAREEFAALAITLRELEPLISNAETQDKRPPHEVIQHAIEGWYGDYLKTVYLDWERRREDLNGLITFAERFATMPELLAQLVLLNSETTEKGLEMPDEAVRMTTVHQAKGLEYPVVFVIGAADELFPLRRAIEEGDVEEERRLFYVAVTRAREQLFLLSPMVSSGRGAPLRLEESRFLREIPTERFERIGHRARAW